MSEDKKIIVRPEDCVDDKISCPRPDQPLWSRHPKVFLPFDEEGVVRCPYCSTQYQLQK